MCTLHLRSGIRTFLVLMFRFLLFVWIVHLPRLLFLLVVSQALSPPLPYRTVSGPL